MSDDLDDFLDGFDFGDTKPLEPASAEEYMMQRLTETKNPRMEIIRYNLKSNFEFRDELRAKGVKYMREVFSDGGIIYKELSNADYAKVINEDYILRTCQAAMHFAQQDGRGKVNMGKLLDLVNLEPRIKKLIDEA